VPLAEGSCQELTGRVDATDELDDDIHIVPVNEHCGIIGKKTRVKALARAIRMGDSNTSELDLPPHSSGDILRPRFNHPGHLGPHNPAPQQGHAYRLG
jgi:hypothetical protein